MGQEESIDDLDFSPRETLTRFVENCFPIRCYEEQTDAHSGAIVYVAVLSKRGEHFESRAALELKRELTTRSRTPADESQSSVDERISRADEQRH